MSPVLDDVEMLKYMRDCMSQVEATKKDPAHVSLLPCPPWQDPKDAGVTDEKFRVSAVEKQFLSSLKLPFDRNLKGSRGEKDMAVRYRYLVRLGASTVASGARSIGQTPGECDQPAPTAAAAAASDHCEKLQRLLHLEKVKNAANQKVS